MTSSREKPARPGDDLPPAVSSMWRLCKLGYRHEPALIVASFALVLLAALPDALLAFWFKLLGEGALARDWPRVRLAVLALGVSATATWFLQTVSVRVQRRFRDKVTIALESHVATLLASLALPFVWTQVSNPWLWAGMAFMGLMGTVGHFMLILAYRNAPASTLTPYLYSQIAFAMVGGWLVFEHLPDGWSLIGMALIAACGALGAWLTVRESRVPTLREAKA